MMFDIFSNLAFAALALGLTIIAFKFRKTFRFALFPLVFLSGSVAVAGNVGYIKGWNESRSDTLDRVGGKLSEAIRQKGSTPDTLFFLGDLSEALNRAPRQLSLDRMPATLGLLALWSLVLLGLVPLIGRKRSRN